MKITQQQLYLIIGAILIVIAFLVGHSCSTEPVDTTNLQQEVDSLKQAHDEALQEALIWKEAADRNIQTRDSLLLKYVELKNKQGQIRYVKVYDSIRTLGTDELQEYFTTRYPPEGPGGSDNN